MASTLALGNGVGGTWIHFLRASGSTGPYGLSSYISVEFVLPSNYLTVGATLNINQCVNGSIAQLGSTTVAMADGATVRTVIWGLNLWVYPNNVLVMTQILPSATAGNPGVGGSTSPGGFTAMQVGARWTTPPAAISSNGFSNSVYPLEAYLRWQAPGDGAGPGIYQYAITRNGSAFGTSPGTQFIDEMVQPATSYT